MNIRDVMTPGVKEVGPDTSLREAAECMKELNIGLLPVCSDEHLVGVLTDRDITVRAVAEGCDPNHARVGQIMTSGIHFCFDDDGINEAARIMEEHQVRRLIVCDRKQRAVGIVSLGDIATRVHDERLSGEILQGVSEMWHPMAG